jgi:histidine triad (HIT) family protein
MSDPNRDCVFCRVIAGELPSDRLHEDEDLVVIRDRAPAAPFHALVIPRRHLESADSLLSADAGLAGRLVLVATEVARANGLVKDGYRLVMNTGEGAGQTVFHLHLHILGGRRMETLG